MYLSQCQGAAHLPLIYLIWDDEAVVPNADPVAYNTVDDYLMTTAMLTRDHFKIDNAWLYSNIKPLLVDGAGWAFI